MPPKKEEKSETPSKKEGDSNLMAALGYVINLLGLPLSLILYFVKKEDKFVKFHALQASIFWIATAVVFVALTVVLGIIAVATAGLGAVLFACTPILGLVFLVIDLYAAYKAFQGEKYMIPVVGPFCEKYV